MRSIRGRHLDRAKNVVPALHDRAQYRVKVGAAIKGDQHPRLFLGWRLA